MISIVPFMVSGISKSFGDKPVLSAFSATFAQGGVHAVLGPSGCGKTTLLRILSGLESADSGTHSFPRVPCSWVFQDSRLLPWMSVEKNILHVLPGGAGRVSRAQRAGLLLPLLELMRLSGQEKLLPAELSGGMARRAALARALAVPSPVLYLDEPFTGLDEALRADVAHDVISFVRRRGTTVLWVTHDRDLALSFADSLTELESAAR